MRGACGIVAVATMRVATMADDGGDRRSTSVDGLFQPDGSPQLTIGWDTEFHRSVYFRP